MDVPLEQASRECGDGILDSKGTASQPSEIESGIHQSKSRQLRADEYDQVVVALHIKE